MKIKRIFFVCVFGALIAGGSLFAQQGQGYIRPTASLGFGMIGEASGIMGSFDIDFVNSFGLTLGVQGLFLTDSGVTFTGTPFGVGYTYDGGKWCVGGKFMFAPIFTDLGIGFDISGTYWFTSSLGLTGIVDLYFLEDPFFSLRAGVSFKY